MNQNIYYYHQQLFFSSTNSKTRKSGNLPSAALKIKIINELNLKPTSISNLNLK